jgi:hypothetical protein
MVGKTEKQNKVLYQCEDCGHFYETEELAKKCEEWCKEHKSCNLEIIKYAVRVNTNGRELNDNKPKNSIQNFIIGVLAGVLIVGGLIFLKVPTGQKESNQNFNQALIQQITSQVLPKEGFKTNLVWKDTVKKMIDCGVIDFEKLNKFYNNQVPEYIQNLISGKSSNEPIVINQETAGYLLNLLWPLGLSNKTEFNKNIPFNEKELRYLASTAGWPLSRAENAADYFNKCEIIKLTPEQEEIVYRVAQNTFRPCCNNSTFAQDCNHGSALLGALELGVTQGYTEDELYKLALKLNSFWFPDTYAKIALYLKLVENKDWPLVNNDIALIKEIMSAKYSSISGFIQNVDQKLAKLNLPGIQGSGGGCGLQ